MIKVAVVDDQTVLRESIKYMIEKDHDIKVVGCGKNGREALMLCDKYSPDVVLMDLLMPDCDGIEGTYLIKSKYKNIKVIILTTFEDEENISNAINNGADGYLLKDVEPEALKLSIKSAVQGLPVLHKNVFNTVIKQYNDNENKNKVTDNKIEFNLNEKELMIISLVVDGKTNKEIAKEINLSEGRVRNIISEILVKLDVVDRTQLAVYAVRNSLV